MNGAKYHAPIVSLLAVLIAGCATTPIPLGSKELNGGLCSSDPNLVERVRTLRVGMCEHEVFNLLGITHDTPNLYNLDTKTVYEHINLLDERPHMESSCKTIHDTEVLYVGHRIPCEQLKRNGYIKGLKWVQRTTGEDSYFDLVFRRGVFISYTEGGVKNKDSKDAAYFWESLFGNPFNRVRSKIAP